MLRDITAAFIGLGALINAGKANFVTLNSICRLLEQYMIKGSNQLLVGLSMAVKRLLQQPRPTETCAFIGKCHKYGMPSSHAQVMAYAFTTALLMHMHRRRNRNNSKLLATEILELFELIVLAGLSALVGIARVYLGYHSGNQVVAGMTLGSGFSALWFLFIATVHSTGIARGIQSFFPALLHLKNDWERGYVHGKPDSTSEKLK